MSPSQFLTYFQSSRVFNFYRSDLWQQTITLQNDIFSVIWKTMFNVHLLSIFWTWQKYDFFFPGMYFMVLILKYPFFHKSPLLQITGTHLLEQEPQAKGDVWKNLKGHCDIHMPSEKTAAKPSFWFFTCLTLQTLNITFTFTYTAM